MNDFMKSLIRTWVPVGIGAFISWLATNYDIVVPADASSSLVVGVVALVTAVYYVLARAVEKAYPWLGKLLVGLGVGSAPEYKEPVPEAVRQVRGY
jgi:hypothetical protein